MIRKLLICTEIKKEYVMKNNFLLKLLTLQQDGEQAISSPSNWVSQDVLLEVPTDTDRIVNMLSKEMLIGENNTIARWHFFIGSPGNGKSTATGKLCRMLIEKQSCSVTDERNININDLEQTALPYELCVYEGNKHYASGKIVQDASVVRSPFSKDADPANDFIETLKDAWEKGMSLVVSTNRGIIEKAYQERYLDQTINSKQWFKILRGLVEQDPINSYGELEGKWRFNSNNKHVFESVKVSYCYLDNRSLLINSNVFDSLIKKATDKENWKDCGECNNRLFCPFKANCEWLENSLTRERFLQTLKRAEVFSGQIIVFREALALLSFILAGCPRDYLNSKHPCEWVAEKKECGDIFALAMRRIYMCIYSSFTPYGLEENLTLYRKQIKSLKILKGFLQDDALRTAKSLDWILKGKNTPSVDVGVQRLVGASGILTEIDPNRECLPIDFIEFWDGEITNLLTHNIPNFTSIESECIEKWAFMETLIEATPSHEASQCYWALRRWSSNFLIHYGALLNGMTCWEQELDELIKIYETINKDIECRTQEDLRLISGLTEKFEKLLSTGTDSQSEKNSVALSENVTLSGRWVERNLIPVIDREKIMSSLSITVKFPGEKAEVSARAFVWLSALLNKNLDIRCFPRELLTGIMDARVRASAKARPQYALVDNDVVLKIETGENEQFTLTRIDGGVLVDSKRY